MHTPDNVLFLFAHQDDEYFAAPWILEEIRSGAAVACVFLTDGAVSTDPLVRDTESRGVLRSLGITNVEFLNDGGRRIADQCLAAESAPALALLSRWTERYAFAPTKLYAPSYEGGHPDHDAAHLIAAALALQRGIVPNAWHFSLYNAYRAPRPFFRTMRQLPTSKRRRGPSMHLEERWKTTWLCSRYRTQRKTWIGLFPGAFYRRMLLRSESVVEFDLERLAGRPHQGQLLYERMFGMDYAHFAELTRGVSNQISAGSHGKRGVEC